MAPNRWISESLVNMLIGMKDYKAAAEVESGSTEMFALYSQRIEETIASKSPEKLIGPTGEFVDLSDYVLIAVDEITRHKAWQQEVLSKLPKEDDENGSSGPLRQAFHQAATEREKLFQQIAKYLKAVS